MGKYVRTLVAAALVATLAAVAQPADASQGGFGHGVVFIVDGEEYFLQGPPDGPGGALDIPGHTWVQTGPGRIQGKHYNTGPFGAPSWWSSDAGDGALLYVVSGVIDSWTPAKAEDYAARGYTHYHEFVSVETGAHHPELVVWLRHHAVAHFTLDGGPRPDLAHPVSPGIDFAFIPNAPVPYEP